MQMIMKILAVVERRHKDKPVADIVLMSTNGGAAITVVCWNPSYEKGDHKFYQQLLGNVAVCDIRPDVFNGSLQYQLGFDRPIAMEQFAQQFVPKKVV
jgi:hypothetical protein